jgi:glucose/arabinose dehydrogenase
MRVFCASLFLVFLALPSLAFAQGDPGCGLIQWVRDAPAGSMLTPDTTLEMYDTTIRVNNRNRTVRLVKGFKVSVFATAPAARGLAFSDDGVLYVAARGNGGTVWAFPDHNKDGVPDSSIIVRNNVGSIVHGIGFYQKKLYASTDSRMFRLEDDNGDRVADRSVDFLTFPGGGGHVTRVFVFDTARKKLFVGVGSETQFFPLT